MALGLTKVGGSDQDFLPSFRFNAVSGDAIIVSSAKNAKTNEWEKVETAVPFPQKFVFDFENLEVGWMKFTVSGPSYVMVKIGERMPELPNGDKDYKQGFSVKMFSKTFGLTVFSNSSKTIAEVMDILHDQYLTGSKEHPGKLPVVEIKGTKKISIKTKEGAKNYKQPEWAIVSWVDRPEGMRAAIKEVEATKEIASEDDF